MGLSIWQIALVMILLVLLFGRGKLSGLMTDFAEGVKSFRKTMSEGADAETGTTATIQQLETADVSQASQPQKTTRVSD